MDIQPFSKSISFGEYSTEGVVVFEGEGLGEEEYGKLKDRLKKVMEDKGEAQAKFMAKAERVNYRDLREGRNLKEKVGIFIKKAGVGVDEGKWLRKEIESVWNNVEELQGIGGYQGSEYNIELIEKLRELHGGWRKSVSWKKIPSWKRKAIELEETIGATRIYTKEDKERIYKTEKGIVPPWWDIVTPRSYFKGAAKIIEEYNMTASEVEDLIKSAVKGRRNWKPNELKAVGAIKIPTLEEKEKSAIYTKWGQNYGDKIISGDWTPEDMKHAHDNMGKSAFFKLMRGVWTAQDYNKIRNVWGQKITGRIFTEKGWQPPKELSPEEVHAIYSAWGINDGDKIISGKWKIPKNFDRGFSEPNMGEPNMMIPCGEFYYKGIGWY